MSDKRPLTDEERAPYLAYFQDGIWDILLGIWLLTWGLTMLLNAVYLPALMIVVALPMTWKLKKRITVSRLEPMRYTLEQLNHTRQRTGIAIFSGELVLCLGILLFIALQEKPEAGQWLAPWGWLLFGVILALAIGLVGYLYQAMSWAVYAFLLLTLVVASVWFGLELGWCMMLAGGLVLASGVGILGHFQQNHPPLVFR